MPITWRSVKSSSPEYGAAALLGRNASDSFNRGFEAIQGVVADRQKLMGDNYKVQGTNNNNTLLDALAGKTPDEIQAFKDSGGWDALVNKVGPNVDPTVRRDALGNALTKSRESEIASYQFGETQAQQDAKPYIDEYQAALYAGDSNAVAAIRNDPTKWGAIMAAGQGDDLAREKNLEADRLLANKQSLYNFNRGVLEDGREDDTYNREQKALKTSDAVDALLARAGKSTATQDAQEQGATGTAIEALELPQATDGGVDIKSTSTDQLQK
jgi:hypothetical protein